ncbi:MAG: thiol reductant ABC exporter subunit CydC [Candidatus Nanopelagicales bacterium]
MTRPATDTALGTRSVFGSKLGLAELAQPDRARLTLAALLAFLALASGVALLATSAWLIAFASQRPPILYLQVAIVSVRFLGLGRGVFRYAERLVGHDAALRGLTNVRVAIFARLERLSPAGLGQYRHGDLLARLVADVDQSMDLQVRVWVPVSAALATGLAGALLGVAILPLAGLALLAMALVSGLFVPTLSYRLGRAANQARAAADAELTIVAVGSLDAAGDLYAYDAQGPVRERLAAADARARSLAASSATATGVGAAVNTLISGLTVVAGLAAGVSAASGGRLNPVNLAVLALLPLALADALAGMPAAALSRARVAGASQRVCEVMATPDPVPSGGAPVPPAEPLLAQLRALSAGYPGGPEQSQISTVISDIDLRLGEGRRVALVGPSGAGKSTLAAVLVRFLDYGRGSAELGGADLRELDDDEVRRAVGLLTQDAHLFDTTIAENIRLARRNASDEQFAAALEGAALTDWLAELPLGVDTRVGTHGRAVSGGQRQRIALARALLAEREIQILDEPAEHLDTPLADRLTADILAAVEQRGLLLITHRLTGTAECDEVVVMVAGRVVERGSPQDLLRAGGYYADLSAREAQIASTGALR